MKNKHVMRTQVDRILCTTTIKYLQNTLFQLPVLPSVVYHLNRQYQI